MLSGKQNTQQSTKRAARKARARAQRRAQGKRAGSSSQPVRANIAQGKVRKILAPRFDMTGQFGGDVVVSHREYFSEAISSSTASGYVVRGYQLDPSNRALFPWLSSLSRNYEKFLFEELHVIYETQSPSTLAGSVLMAVDYNALDPPPLNKSEIMQLEGAVRSPVWSDMRYSCKKEDLVQRKTLYVNATTQSFELGGAHIQNIAVTGDERLNALGTLWIASQGISTANVNMGELYVEYRVRLMTPTWVDTVNLRLVSKTSNVGVTRFVPFGATSAYDVSFFTEGHLSSGYNTPGGDGVFYFPPGQYLILIRWDCTNTGGAPTLAAVGTGTIVVDSWSSSGSTTQLAVFVVLTITALWNGAQSPTTSGGLKITAGAAFDATAWNYAAILVAIPLDNPSTTFLSSYVSSVGPQFIEGLSRIRFRSGEQRRLMEYCEPRPPLNQEERGSTYPEEQSDAPESYPPARTVTDSDSEESEVSLKPLPSTGPLVTRNEPPRKRVGPLRRQSALD